MFSGTVSLTGKGFECEVCNIFHFEDGLVVRWHAYGDFAAAVAVFSAG